jgi:hypothetical protein
MRRLVATLLVLALAATGCGDDESAEPSTSTTTGSEEATEPEATTEADGPTGSTTGSTVPTDAPAGDGPDGGGGDDGMGDALLVAELGADEEVPGPGAAGAAGRFEAELADGMLCIDMVVRDIGDLVTGAHVHDGGAGTAGPVLVDLGDPTTLDPANATWTDVCTEVPDDVIERIAAAPEQHYVNVHAVSFPDGAVRGQLSVASVFDRTLD